MADEIVVFVNRLIAVRDKVRDLQGGVATIPAQVYSLLVEIETLLGISQTAVRK